MRFLFNPFEKYSEKVLLSVGVLFMLVGSYLAFVFDARFDGVLDFHFVSEVLPRQPLVDNVINIACLTLLLFTLGKYLNTRTRLVDVLVTVIVARSPYYLLPLLNVNNIMMDMTNGLVEAVNSGQANQISGSGLSVMLLFSLVIILVLVWYIYLLYQGFKVAVNSKETKGLVLFFVILVLAEILSKYVIIQLN